MLRESTGEVVDGTKTARVGDLLYRQSVIDHKHGRPLETASHSVLMYRISGKLLEQLAQVGWTHLSRVCKP